MPITRNLNFQTDDTQKPFDDVESTNSVTKQQRSENVESRSIIPSGEASKERLTHNQRAPIDLRFVFQKLP